MPETLKFHYFHTFLTFSRSIAGRPSFFSSTIFDSTAAITVFTSNLTKINKYTFLEKIHILFKTLMKIKLTFVFIMTYLVPAP